MESAFLYLDMDFAQFLKNIQDSKDYEDQVACVRRIEARSARHANLAQPLPPELVSALRGMGITALYTHQVAAIEQVRRGGSVVVVTGTASGKTLCYNLPVLETIITQPSARALYIFPTKALAQDQLRGLKRWAEIERALARTMKAGTYDGDTPPSARRKLRDEANIILTNPDMLHQGILPYHTRWSRFFADLRYVVIDEIHTYRGIFGSNVANVFRRLRRICSFYAAKPVFICCSATIANPLELAERLTGLPMTLIANDGSPRGPRIFVLWNPPVVDAMCMERRSSNVEAQRLMTELIRNGVQTIAFGRARIVAELMYRYVKEALQRLRPDLAERVRPYRGGYLPEERREIERLLFSGELMGVTSTNALELGIDIGGLDAAIIIGFPGTVASIWQQAGRAGRGERESLVVFVAYNDPIDQYLMRRPDYFFEQTPEAAVIDPENPYILANHLRCAAFELPLNTQDSSLFGAQMGQVAGILEEAGELKRIRDSWYYSTPAFPAAGVNLRTISENTFTIVEKNEGSAVGGSDDGYSVTQIADASDKDARRKASLPHNCRVIGQVDSISAPELVYPQAVYIHEGETYLVDELDLDGRVAYVRRADVDYYTNAVLDASIRIPQDVEGCGETLDGFTGSSKIDRNQQILARRFGDCTICYGPAIVTWATTGFKKIKFYSLDSIGYGKVDLPPQHLETMAFWIIFPKELLGKIHFDGYKPFEGLHGIRNLAVHVLPLFAMCDKQDIGGIVDSSNTGAPTIFIYDRYPGGIGFAEKGYQIAEKLMASCKELVDECSCQEGCPSCVGLPLLRPPIHSDPDVFGAFPIPDKRSAAAILHEVTA